MNRNSALLAVCFCAGLLGALINSAALWLAGAKGLTAMAGVAIAPDLTPAWLYPRLVWGGLWGIIYFLTVGAARSRQKWIRKGLYISLLPTSAQLFYFFPQHTPHGMMGLGLGDATPVFVLGFNLIWGLFTGLFARILWGRD